MIPRIFIPLNQFVKKVKTNLWHLENTENLQDLTIKNLLIFQREYYADDMIIESEYIRHGQDLDNCRPVNISIPIDSDNNKYYMVIGYKESSKYGLSFLINTLFSKEDISRFSIQPKEIRSIYDKLQYLCNIGLTYKAFKMINTFIDRKSFKTIQNFKAEMKSESHLEFENKMMQYYKSNVERVRTRYNVKFNNVYLNTKLFFLCFYIVVKINDNVEFIHIDSKRKPIKIDDKSLLDRYYRGISFIKINKNGG